MKTQTCANCGQTKEHHGINRYCFKGLIHCGRFKPSHNHSPLNANSEDTPEEVGNSQLNNEKTSGTHSSDVRITDFNKDMIEDERKYYGETYDETR